MKQRQSITEVLRQAIIDSEMSFLALEQQTGVIRQSLMPFARGESNVSLAAADKLAQFFNLELRPATKPKKKGAD